MHIGRNSFISPETIIEQPENIYIGENVKIKPGVVLRPETGIITIGNNVVINHYTVLHAKGGIEIGDWTIIAPHCGIYAQNHTYNSFNVPITKQQNKGAGITLMGDNWLGAGCIILDGVTLGKGTVVGAGAIVTKSFPMAKILAGNPARIIQHRFPKDQWNFQKVERFSESLTPKEYRPYVNQRAIFGSQYLAPANEVLDIGCGEGYITNMLKDKCKRIIGIDYSEEAVSEAKHNHPSLEFYHMPCTDLLFRTESFDKVICFELLEHLTILQSKRAISEMYRVLKPGGMIVGSTPIRSSEDSTRSTYSHIHEFSESELLSMLSIFQDFEIFSNGCFFTGRKSQLNETK